MILQALYDYYQRKAADPESKIAPQGFEWKEIPFLIVINTNGKFVNLEDTRTIEGKNKRANTYLLPRSVTRSGTKFIPNLLWDTEEYVLGTVSESKIKHETFKSLVFEKISNQLPDEIGIKAIIDFYRNNETDVLINCPIWEEFKRAKNPNVSFKLVGEIEPIPCKESVKQLVLASIANSVETEVSESINEPESIIKGICLVTGKNEIIARTHQKTFINKDANILVSFQKGSGYDSYGKEQGYNASVGVPAEFAYTTALKMLIKKGSRHKFNIAGTSIVFWAEKQTELENNFSFFFSNSFVQDNPEHDLQSLKSALESIFSGRLNEEGDTKFFILGLCQGGGSRIAIRFWKQGTVKQISNSIASHFNDLSIKKPKQEEHEYFTLYSLLRSIVLKGELDNLPPNLSGALIEAILDENHLYPATLQQQCIRRIRAEQHVNRIRAAILKAYLNRKNRIHNSNEKTITMALDLDNTNQGYLCGRLFAVLEKVQEEAQPGINATIKDRFYGAASSTPVTVFGRLLNLTNHHLAKLNPGRKTNIEKLIQGVMASVSSNGMPTHLSLDDQSRFAIGYYHQRQELFISKENKN